MKKSEDDPAMMQQLAHTTLCTVPFAMSNVWLRNHIGFAAPRVFSGRYGRTRHTW